MNEADLAEALKSGHVGGAALDVHEIEPYGDSSPLWGCPNLICTPHTAYFSDQSAIEIRRLAAEEVSCGSIFFSNFFAGASLAQTATIAQLRQRSKYRARRLGAIDALWCGEHRWICLFP